MGRGSQREMNGGISSGRTVARRSRIVSETLEEASFTFLWAVRANFEMRGSDIVVSWMKET